MWTVTFTVEDAKGKQSSFGFNFDASRTLAQIEGWVASIGVPITAMINGAVRAINIARRMAIPLGFPVVANANSDVEEKAFVNMRTGTGFPTKTTIPTLDEGVVVAGSNVLDQTLGAVIAFISSIEDGVSVGGVNVKPSDNRGDAVTEVVSLTEVFTASKGS